MKLLFVKLCGNKFSIIFVLSAPNVGIFGKMHYIYDSEEVHI